MTLPGETSRSVQGSSRSGLAGLSAVADAAEMRFPASVQQLHSSTVPVVSDDYSNAVVVQLLAGDAIPNVVAVASPGFLSLWTSCRSLLMTAQLAASSLPCLLAALELSYSYHGQLRRNRRYVSPRRSPWPSFHEVWPQHLHAGFSQIDFA